MRCAMAVSLVFAFAAALAAQDGGGIFYPEGRIGLYRTHHGEPPGHPGCMDEKDEEGRPKYPAWGHPMPELYPGSVEHYRGEQEKYLPIWPMVEATSLVKNFRATELPGAAGRIEDYAEPVWYLPMYGIARDTGRRNPPVKVVRCSPQKPVFSLDLGVLEPSLYCIRLIGAAESRHVEGIRDPLYIELKVNDQPGGGESRYRLRCGYTDEFYSIAEFHFYAPEPRAYRAEMYVGEGSTVDILAYNMDLHDLYTGLVRGPIKQRVNTFDPTVRDALRAEIAARLAAGDAAWLENFRKQNSIEWRIGTPYRAEPLTPEARRARDEELWYSLPPINTQTRGGYGTAPFGPGTPEAAEALKTAGRWALAGPWDTKWELVNRELGLRYTWEDLRDNKPLSEPWPIREDAGGFTFPLQAGQQHRFTMATIAEAVTRRIGDYTERLTGRAFHWAGLAGRYHFTGDREAARDAAMALVRVAYLVPTWDESRLSLNAAICGRTSDLNWGGKDQWTTRRLTRTDAGLYNQEYLVAYDRLFDFIQGNEELAAAVHRFIPWVRTPEDVVTFLDMNLLQYTAKRQARFHLHRHDLFPTVMATGNTDFTRPWMEFLFRETYEYPNARAGWPDYAITSTQRSGTSYIGSWYYAMDGGPAMRYAERTQDYVARGGDPRFDMSDVRRFPKALAACRFQIEGRAAGLHALGVGDVNGPNLPYGHWFTLGPVEHQARLGWRWSKDPRFAYILANYFAPKDESPEEWGRIEQAAQGVPNPWFEQRSRVLSDWAAILEAGVEHTDFRFRRAAMVRVGYGFGHQHDDVLDLILWAHGVIHASVGGERPEQRKLGDVHEPKNQTSYTHNMVEVDGTGGFRTGRHRGYSWVRTLKDTDGARYTFADSFPHLDHPYLSVYRRQVALIDVNEGTPLEREPSEPREFHPSFRLPPVEKTPDAYVFDVFRVRGGRRHTYAFHGCEDDEFASNALNVRAVGFRYGANADTSDEAQYLNKFVVADSKTAGVAPEVLQATWRLARGGDPLVLTLPENDAEGNPQPTGRQEMPRRNTERSILGASYDEAAPRKYTRLHLLDHAGAKVLTGTFVATSPGTHMRCLFAQRDLPGELARGDPGDLQSVFPAIIEMYEGEPVVASARSVPVENNEADALRAAAVEVTLTDGRKDLLFSDGRPETERRVAQAPSPVAGAQPVAAVPHLRVAGEFAFLSTDAQGVRQMTLVGGTLLAAHGGMELRPAVAARTGRIVAVDYYAKQVVIEGMAVSNPALLRGQMVEVGTPDHRTSYMVQDATLADGRVTLTFDKGMDYYSSRIQEVRPDERTVRCGLGFPTDGGAVYPGMSKGLVASNEALTKFWRAEYLGGTREAGYLFRLDAPVSAEDFGEKGGLRVWEMGVGDEVRIPTHASLRREADGGWTLQADAACALTLPAARVEVSADGAAWNELRSEAPGIFAATIGEAQLGSGTVRIRFQ